MNNKVVNIAIQILPLKTVYASPTQLIDKAIEIIKRSGLNYKVCPFETVVEGEYSKIMEVVSNIQQECFNNGAEEIICNLKIHSHLSKNVHISDKMSKYE